MIFGTFMVCGLTLIAAITEEMARALDRYRTRRERIALSPEQERAARDARIEAMEAEVLI